MKEFWRERLTTVFPRQGHYALDRNDTATFPPANIIIDSIGDLAKHDLAAFLDAALKAI
jgi:hypothetical protein